MGFRIGTLRALPTYFGCYFFLLGDYRQESSQVSKMFNCDFNVIADRLGPDSAIIAQTINRQLENELIGAMTRRVIGNSELSSFFRTLECGDPGLLITKKHPDIITKDDTIIYLPFSTLDETYRHKVDELFGDLISFAKGENTNLIKKSSENRKVLRDLLSHFSVTLGYGLVAINYQP